MTKYEYSKLAYINPKELNRVQRLTDFESDVNMVANVNMVYLMVANGLRSTNRRVHKIK